MYQECAQVFDAQMLLDLGKHLDIAPGPGGSRFSPWEPTMKAYKGFLDEYFPGANQAALVALYPSSQIVSHCDAPIKGVRCHIPLQVNDGCWTFHNGAWMQLEAGHCYMMDPTEPHGAVNWGHTLRLHLLIDR